MTPFTSDINNKSKTIISGFIDKKYISRKGQNYEGDVKGDIKKFIFFLVIDGEACPVDKKTYDLYSLGQHLAIHLAPESGFILNIESDNRRFMKTSV